MHREALALPMQLLKRFCDNICRFRKGVKMSFSLTSNGWVFFTFPFKKGTFPKGTIQRELGVQKIQRVQFNYGYYDLIF